MKSDHKLIVTIIVCFVSMLILFLPVLGNAEFKEIISEGAYNMGDGETPTIAESRALLNAKQAAMEEAGTYVESYSKVENLRLSRDEIQVIASGIMEVVVLDKKRTIEGEGFRFWVKIRTKVTTDKISDMAKRVKERNIVDDYKKIQEAYAKSQKEIDMLKKELAQAKNPEKKKQIEENVAKDENLFSANQLLEKGKRDYLNRDYDAAIASYTAALSLNDQNAFAYSLRGFIYYYAQDDYDLAIEDYNRAIALEPKKASYYDQRGLAYESKGNHDMALKDYDRAIVLEPKNAMYYAHRGKVHEGTGKLEKAIRDYDHAIALEHKDTIKAIYYDQRGLAYWHKGERDRAMKDFKKAIALDPDNTFYYSHLAHIYNGRGLYDQAIKEFSKALSIKPKNPDIYRARATVYDAKREYIKAFEDYNKAIYLNPNDSNTFISRGYVLSAMSRYDQAIDDFNQAQQFDEKNYIVIASYARGKAYLPKGDYQNAIKEFTQALGTLSKCERHDSFFSDVYAGRADAYFAMNLDNKAIQDYDNAITCNSKNAHAYSKRAGAYVLTGKFYQALEDYNKTIALNPLDAGYYRGRGLVYAVIGNELQYRKDTEKACSLGDRDACKELRK